MVKQQQEIFKNLKWSRGVVLYETGDSTAFVLLGLSGCAGDNEEMKEMREHHKLTVTAGEQEIACTLVNQELDSMDAFKALFAEAEIKSIKTTETLLLKFEGDQPIEVTVKDILLSSEGNYLYPDKLSPGISLTNKNNSFSFVPGKNTTSALNSKFEPGKMNYRGFKIDATWESAERTYIFAIKEK
ncbi:hypothetical protein J41TS12_48790 [Paenibacillus antibioticophila]|uniref:Uncharacterized protein n=1 Tax=Paenibacillus antibioticophila TaxID=1274374 RepID=A0A920CJU0_9BACL|nr:hypothetical protein [Paenibacillus antibioticophila]GIO40018.1 hypothetical protein J41TS12_48790 [Paenibacillus antibioticophila]